MVASGKGTGTLRSVQGATQARIMGVGGYRPERVVTNDEVCELIDSTDEWIRERSGIRTRHRAAAGETVIDLAQAASLPALEMAGVEARDIDVVIVATVTYPYQTPAAAPILATRLGTSGAAAFDLSAACAGYCHGIAVANDLVRGGSASHVLVVGVEKLSDFTDPRDRGTAFIFGDGAGAAVVGPSPTPGIGPTVWGSDGEQWDAIAQRESWVQVRDQHERGELPPRDHYLAGIDMKGQTVFRWAVWGMAPVAQQAMDRAGISAADLDAFIPHQANLRIIDAMVKKLGLPSDIPVARDVVDTANTSSASVPLATERMLREAAAPRGGLALQIGYGAGLSYAAQVVVLP